jgi:diacylglycerol kinase family enzyme
MAIGAKACVNDAKLDVCVFKGDGFFTFVQHAIKVLSHSHLQDPKVEYYQCSEIVVESACSLPVHMDGDPFMKTPIAIRTIPSSLKVIVPKTVPGSLFSPLACYSPYKIFSMGDDYYWARNMNLGLAQAKAGQHI